MSDTQECVICKGTIRETLFEALDNTKSGQKFPVQKCGGCGLVITGDAPNENEIGTYYESEDYAPHHSSKGGLMNFLYRSVRTLMLRYKLKIVRKATRINNGDLLDYGTGTGEFAIYAASKGWLVKGVEINDDARELTNTKSGVNVISPSDLSELKDGSFDCVTMWHVLEHLHNPANLINKMKGVLRPDGVLLVAVPNIGSFDSIYYKGDWAALDVPRHLWHFSPDSMKRFMEKNGFNIVAKRRLIFDSFYVSLLSEKNRIKGSSIRALMIGGASLVNSLLKRDKCSSLIYICRKSVTP